MNKEELTLEQSIEILEDMFIRENDKNLYEFILEVLERPIIEKVLEKTNGNQTLAAKILGISQNTLRAKIKKSGIKLLQQKEGIQSHLFFCLDEGSLNLISR